MRIDERYYRRVFHTQHRELHEAVIDYISYFLHRRKTLDAETTVEQIRRHCERAIGCQIPLDYFIGAMLYVCRRPLWRWHCESFAAEKDFLREG